MDACWGLSYLSDGPSEQIQVQKPSPPCAMTRVFGGEPMLAADPGDTYHHRHHHHLHLCNQAVIQAGCLPMLVALLDSPIVEVLSPTIRTIGNLVTGSDTHTQMVVEANVLTPLRKLVASSKPDIVRLSPPYSLPLPATNPGHSRAARQLLCVRLCV